MVLNVKENLITQVKNSDLLSYSLMGAQI